MFASTNQADLVRGQPTEPAKAKCGRLAHRRGGSIPLVVHDGQAYGAASPPRPTSSRASEDGMVISAARHSPKRTGKGNGSQPYQLLPPLSPDEFAALKADIAKHGILVAVELDDHGHLLDGHHRVRAWQELRAEGIRVPDFPRVIRAGLSEAEKRAHVRAVNLVRAPPERSPAPGDYRRCAPGRPGPVRPAGCGHARRLASNSRGRAP